MPTLPELLDEDVQEIEKALRDFLAKSEATLALVTAEGGFLVIKEGAADAFDCVTLGALSSNAFSASQAIAGLIEEPNLTQVYQQGERFSLLTSSVDHYNTLVVVFPAQVSVGAVKFYIGPAVAIIAAQLRKAQRRASNKGIDLALLNVSDSTELFRRKSA